MVFIAEETETEVDEQNVFGSEFLNSNKSAKKALHRRKLFDNIESNAIRRWIRVSTHVVLNEHGS